MNRTLRLALIPLSLALFAGAQAADAPADELTTLRAENKQLSAELATSWKEMDLVKADLAAAQATAAKAGDDAIALHKELDAMKAAAAAAPAPAPVDDGSKQALADTQKELAQAKADLATAQASVAADTDQVTALKKELDDAKAAVPVPAPTPAPAVVAEATPTPAAAAPADDDTKKALADAQDKVEMTLHSYTLLQDENTQLKAQIAKDDSDKANVAAQLDAANSSIESLKVQAAVATQVDTLRTQLRQSQDEVASLAGANEQLRNKLALATPLASELHPTPIRPVSPNAYSDTPMPAEPVVPVTKLGVVAATPTGATPITAPTATVAAPAATGPRTYVVAEGDTLGQISKKFYGTSAKWEEILKANHLKSDKSLAIGKTLTIP